MNHRSFIFRINKKFANLATAAFLILIIGVNSFAQYKGAPVKKDRLIKALRSRQLQTNDIVAIIKSNGVDFSLTPEVVKELIAAGARPAVVNAVSENLRLTINSSIAANSRSRKVENTKVKINKTSAPSYDELLDQATLIYKNKKDSTEAAQFLETAIKINPKDPAAYQMLGFVNLYGLENLTDARKYMRDSIENGGSAVFRVYHDDNGDFTKRCAGSLYISPENIRFESDDNIHTFETSTINIHKFKLDQESSRIWKDHSIFKVSLKIGTTDAKFRFAPITGKEEESNMIALFVQESQSKNLIGSSFNIFR